jgi:hypothetical protein
MNTYISTDFLKIIIKWKLPLGIVFLASILFSVVFSGPKFVKPLYKSEAIVYPINIFSYSEESETEQMLQLFNSSDLKKMVIDSLDLYKHYKINRDRHDSEMKILKQFEKRVVFKRTQYESIKIEVTDRYPKHAQLIAIETLNAYNRISLKLMRDKANEILVIKEKLYFDKARQVDSLKTIIDTLIQSSNLAEYYILRESMRGNYQFIKNASEKDEDGNVFSDASFQLFYNQSLLERELNILVELKEQYELALSDTKKELVFADVVSAPSLPQKSVYPIRWIIVLISTIASCTLAFATVLVLDKKMQLKK